MLHVKRAYHYRAAELARLEVGELSLSTDYDALSAAVVCGWGQISIGRSVADEPFRTWHSGRPFTEMTLGKLGR